MSRPGEAVRVAWTVVRRAHDLDVEYPAASLAYYGFISLFPLLVLAIAVLSPSVASQIRQSTPPFLTPGARQLVYEAMADGPGRTGATVLAALVLVWSGVNVTLGFRSVVERAEGSVGESPLEWVRDAICVLGSLCLAIVTTVLTSVLVSLFALGEGVETVGLALFAALTVVFLPLYYVPSTRVTSLRAALPGAVTAAAGWTVLLGVAHVYAVNAAQYAIYGVISGIIIVLTSLYAAALVLLVGVVLNATLVSSSST